MRTTVYGGIRHTGLYVVHGRELKMQSGGVRLSTVVPGGVVSTTSDSKVKVLEGQLNAYWSFIITRVKLIYSRNRPESWSRLL